jgi:branched-chain amino acid aminotransferase
MGINRSKWIWMTGRWVRWEEANVHVTTHALHYGSSVFEGVRAYETPDGPAIFRLHAHTHRLFDSCKIARMPLGDTDFDESAIDEVCIELVRRNGHRSCYLRPLVYRGSGTLGLNPTGSPIEIVILSMEWGTYLGEDALKKGVDAGVSSWRRFAPSSLAPLAKIGGQYVSNQLVSLEARANGYVEGIMLDAGGCVCEGAGENLFLVDRGALITPPLASGILSGITRDSVLALARDLDIPVRVEEISRERLYICDEIFMTGTAAEVTPVRSVDRIPVGSGAPGPVTRRIQKEFFGIVSGEVPDRHGWLTLVAAARTPSRPPDPFQGR